MACVEWQQAWQRRFDTEDTAQDIIIDSTSTYTFTAFIYGTQGTATGIYYPSMSVDFSNWDDDPVQLLAASLFTGAAVLLTSLTVF